MTRTLNNTLSLEERGNLTEAEQALANLSRGELRELAAELRGSERTASQTETLLAAERALSRLS